MLILPEKVFVLIDRLLVFKFIQFCTTLSSTINILTILNILKHAALKMLYNIYIFVLVEIYIFSMRRQKNIGSGLG